MEKKNERYNREFMPLHSSQATTVYLYAVHFQFADDWTGSYAWLFQQKGFHIEASEAHLLALMNEVHDANSHLIFEEDNCDLLLHTCSLLTLTVLNGPRRVQILIRLKMYRQLQETTSNAWIIFKKRKIVVHRSIQRVVFVACSYFTNLSDSMDSRISKMKGTSTKYWLC